MPESDTLRPITIRRIREARGETQAEFASHLDVAPTTIGYWERAEQTPMAENQAAIRELMPDNFDLDAVQAEHDWSEQRAALPEAEKRMFSSKPLRKIRDRPRINDEFATGKGVADLTAQQRQVVERLDLSAVQGSVERSGSRVDVVYYLVGDERRAVRRFIEENEQIVGKELSKEGLNRISKDWDDFRYSLLKDEWRFWICA